MSTQYIHFTDAQKEQARQSDLVFLLESQGETVKRSGREHQWRDGSAKATICGNLWFHQYDRDGGDAIDFVRRFYNNAADVPRLLGGGFHLRHQWGYNLPLMACKIASQFCSLLKLRLNKSYPEAVEYLLGGSGGTLDISPPIVKDNKPFELPQMNDNMRRAYAYLLKRRKIDRDVVCAFTDKNMICESLPYHNVVFIGFDTNGVPRHAGMRGTGSESTYKGNAPNSRPEYSFHWSGTSRYLRLFESPIDMLSFISMHKENWKNHSYVACCGVSDHVLWQMLKDNPNIGYVYLCLDNDKAGQEASHRIVQKLSKQGIQSEILAPKLKDWNEDRKAAAEVLCACGNALRKSAEFSISESQEENLSCPTLQL